jgi:hypothetical protein
MRTPAANRAHLEVELVIDQFAVVEAPGFVLLVGLLAAHVGNLTAVAGIVRKNSRPPSAPWRRRASRERIGARGLFRQQESWIIMPADLAMAAMSLASNSHARERAVPPAISGAADDH